MPRRARSPYRSGQKCRVHLAIALESASLLAVFACYNCIRLGSPCYMSPDRSVKCSSYVRTNARCDEPFSWERFRRLVDEYKMVEEQARRQLQEVIRLRDGVVQAHKGYVMAQEALKRAELDENRFQASMIRLKLMSSNIVRKEMAAVDHLDPPPANNSAAGAMIPPAPACTPGDTPMSNSASVSTHPTPHWTSANTSTWAPANTPTTNNSVNSSTRPPPSWTPENTSINSNPSALTLPPLSNSTDVLALSPPIWTIEHTSPSINPGAFTALPPPTWAPENTSISDNPGALTLPPPPIWTPVNPSTSKRSGALTPTPPAPASTLGITPTRNNAGIVPLPTPTGENADEGNGFLPFNMNP